MRNKKRLLSLIISTICTANIMLCSIPAITAGAETYGVLTYEKADKNGDGSYDHVVITDCDQSVASVNIPSKIAGLPVTNIGKEAFYDCANLSSITISDSVTTIEQHAFFMCKSLKSLTLPKSVTKIEDRAFEDAENLISINIPDGVASIQYGLFSGCDSLESITIPGSVTIIRDEAFMNCNSLSSIAIPDSVTSIGEAAFHGCGKIESVVLSDNVESIGKEAFAECKSLGSITVMNPDCYIYKGKETIYSRWGGGDYFFEGMIYGKAGSTAETYSDESGCKFLAINGYGIVGDADGDKKVSAKDASLLFTEYKSIYNGGQSTFTDVKLGRCDSNGDGKITAIDASKAFSTYKRNYRIG